VKTAQEHAALLEQAHPTEFLGLTEARDREIEVAALKKAAAMVGSHGCCCPHSNVWSSEEWDRQHAAWCPIVLGGALLRKSSI
jgi:hypothetical protein